MTSAWKDEIRAGQRFGFGANWRGYLTRLDEQRIRLAEASLAGLLGLGNQNDQTGQMKQTKQTKQTGLTGLRLLDMGSGSGLFSLAARRLGATVVSCDFDPDSVACTQGLRRSYHPDDPAWTVRQGSVLDRELLAGLGSFDVVYAWGVLHHTGDQWTALDNLAGLVAPGGLLAVALYNHQPFFTPLHRAMKRLACASPKAGLLGISLAYALGVGAALALADALRGRNPLARHRDCGLPRGMNFWHDVVDWVGGWPFETSTPEQVFDFCRARGFELRTLRTVGGKSGCNEFVFQRPSPPAPQQDQSPCAS